MSKAEKAKTILVISSQVIRGAVGNRVNVFILERLGFSVWAMPTVIMPWQPRQGDSHKLAMAAADFAAWAEEIAASDKALEIDAIISGYFVSAAQVEIAAALIQKLRQRRPDIVFLCDPIMGNESGPYVVAEVMRAVAEKLVPIADLVKPNRNELEWICGRELRTNADIIAAVKSRFNVPFFVSSAFPAEAEAMGNLYYQPQQANLFDGGKAAGKPESGAAESKAAEGAGEQIWLAEHPSYITSLNGFGDMLASLFLFHWLKGESAENIARKTTASVYEYLAWTLKLGADELALPSAPYNLAEPQAKVKLRRLSDCG